MWIPKRIFPRNVEGLFFVSLTRLVLAFVGCKHSMDELLNAECNELVKLSLSPFALLFKWLIVVYPKFDHHISGFSIYHLSQVRERMLDIMLPLFKPLTPSFTLQGHSHVDR